MKDRRKVHYGDKTPVSLAAATAVVPAPEASDDIDTPHFGEPDGTNGHHLPGRVV